jgi:paraquat-inducible protein B
LGHSGVDKLDLPKAEPIHKKRFSIVWLLPIVALFFTGWLLFNGYVATGKTITVQLDTGTGIIPGKTPLKYRGITVGKVIKTEVDSLLYRINATIRLDKDAGDIAREGMRFWVVKPQFRVDRITGVETLFSGSYIEVRPNSYDIKVLKHNKEKDFFVALSEEPKYELTGDLARVTLLSDTDPNLSRGAGVFYNNTEVGNIRYVDFVDKLEKYEVGLVVKSRFIKKINSDTRFWQIGGVDVKFDSAGLQIASAPIASIMHGGIAFSSPKHPADTKQKKKYKLYKSYSESTLGEQEIKLTMPSAYGIKAGRTPVLFKGVKVGLVTGVTLNKEDVLAAIKLINGREGLAKADSKFLLRQPEVSMDGVKDLSTVITGVYLELTQGEGEPSLEFDLHMEQVAEVPVKSIDIRFKSSNKGNLTIGSGIFFRGVRIGVIKGYELVKGGVLFEGTIFEEYENLLKKGAYLWMSSALDISFSDGKLNVQSAPTSQIINGGVNLGFFGAGRGSALDIEKVMKLYKSEDAAKEAFIKKKGILKIRLIAGDASGMDKGAPVLYKGTKIGELGNSFLNRKTDKFLISAMISSEYRYLLNKDTYFWKQGEAIVTADATGVKVTTPDIKAMLSGGVEMANDLPNVPKGMQKRIFKDQAEAKKAIEIAVAEKKLRVYASGFEIPVAGSSVFYNGVKAGEIYETGYDQKRKSAFADIYLYKGFKDTINDTTRFWLGGQVDVQADGAGLVVEAGKLSSYIGGTVHYDSFLKSVGTGVIYASKSEAEKPDQKKATLMIKPNYNLKQRAPVIYKGNKIGYVDKVLKAVDAHKVEMMIYNEYTELLREDSVFWLEDVSLSLDGIKNADSMLFGAKIYMLAGNGMAADEFVAKETPVSPFYDQAGLRLVLKGDRRESLETGSPVYFRQVQVGAVETVKLAADGSFVQIGIFIKDEFRHLVQANSVFSHNSGLRASFGFFSGFKFKADSVKSILKGGVSFQNPKQSAKLAKDGAVYKLND